jgi:mannosyl-3-phosphoglycerate phosphatase
MLKRLRVPVVCCSSKTSREIRAARLRLGLSYPFISENGAAVFLPENRFGNLKGRLEEQDGFKVRVLGESSRKIRTVLESVREEMKIGITGFSDMEISTIKSLCNFRTTREAQAAAEREYSEPFVFPKNTSEKKISEVLRRFEKHGLRVIRGKRFFHLVGKSDKGKAVEYLRDAYRRIGDSKSTTMGIGDSRNDIEMLLSVDIPVLVMGNNRRYNRDVKAAVDPILAGAPGPEGWQRAIDRLLASR